jgi:integral membrane protein
MPVLASLVARSYKPKVETIPLIKSALRFYRIGAYITGSFLLLLVVEMVLKYIFLYEIQLGGSSGFIGLVNYFPSIDKAPGLTGINLSIGILIIHGWFYVVYLISDFQLWSRMRWPFVMFILIALGGVVPFLSFIVEHFVGKQARREIAGGIRSGDVSSRDPDRGGRTLATQRPSIPSSSSTSAPSTRN